MARRQGALPGLLRALGVKRHAPRLAARQRGILAFMPLTVVGPGRLLVAGEAARVRPGDESCVSLRSQVPRPLPALKTPHENAPRRWTGSAQDNYAESEVKHFFTVGVIRSKVDTHSTGERGWTLRIPGARMAFLEI